MDADGWLVIAEAAVGVGLTAWAIRPLTWVPASDKVQAPANQRMRLVASAEELGDAERTMVDTWATSTERERFMLRAGRVNSAVLGGALIVASGVTLAIRFPGLRDYGIEISVVGMLVILASGVPISAARMGFRERQKAVAANRVDGAIRQLGTGGLKIAQLFTLNRRQLDEYQELTRRQQRSAFRLTQITSVVAFGALIAAVAITLTVLTTTDKLLSGGLAALGSALSAFLAATFFKAAKSANEQLNRYYLEPQRTGRLLAAERLVTECPGVDKAAMTTILDAIMSWEMPPAVPTKKPAPGAPVPEPSSNGATAPTG